MQRILVGGVAALLLVVSGLWFWQTQANQPNLIPAAPPPEAISDALPQAGPDAPAFGPAPRQPHDFVRKQAAPRWHQDFARGEIAEAVPIEPRRRGGAPGFRPRAAWSGPATRTHAAPGGAACSGRTVATTICSWFPNLISLFLRRRAPRSPGCSMP